MARSPIDIMLDQVAWKCTKCGAEAGTCGCWVELICPECGAKKTVEGDPSDPKGTATVVAHCGECHDGSKSEVFYYDASGKQIMVAATP